MLGQQDNQIVYFANRHTTRLQQRLDGFLDALLGVEASAIKGKGVSP